MKTFTWLGLSMSKHQRQNCVQEVGLEDANLVFRVTELRLAMSCCPHSSTQRATIWCQRASFLRKFHGHWWWMWLMWQVMILDRQPFAHLKTQMRKARLDWIALQPPKTSEMFQTLWNLWNIVISNCHHFETCSAPGCRFTGVDAASDEGTLHFALCPAKPPAAWNAGQRSRLRLWERHDQPGRITCHLDPLQSTWTIGHRLDTMPFLLFLVVTVCHMSYVFFCLFLILFSLLIIRFFAMMLFLIMMRMGMRDEGWEAVTSLLNHSHAGDEQYWTMKSKFEDA